MTDPLLFAVGVVVTAVTVAAVLIVGRDEAKDPALNRPAAPPDASPDA